MTIIVLDASLTVRTKIQDILLDIDSENLEIELFEDAREALEYKRNNQIDLVFSSIETVGMDGISFVDMLLRDDPNFSSKLFIVTSQVNNENIENIKDAGAKRFIKKPINEEYFKHLVIPEIKKALLE